MTFYEAAVSVLREAARPLNAKKITVLAVRGDFLSHVGKNPEETMLARLQQEAKKPAEEAVIEEVRPGVFGLREGVDVDRAAETMSLREPSEDDEPEPVRSRPTQNRDEDLPQPVAAPKIVREDDDRRGGRGRRQRRPRKDEERNSRSTNSEARNDSRDNSDSRDSDGQDNARNNVARQAGRGDEFAVDVPAPTDDLNDVASAVAEILRGQKSARPISASKIADELAKSNVGGLGILGTSGLRATLTEANARRARDGRPPAFTETKPNFWTLATATASSLASSYSALDRWQASHRAALAETLVAELSKLNAEAFGTVVTLLLDRLGYRDLTAHDEPATTLSAHSPGGLTSTKVALRTFGPSTTITPDIIASLRGSLHQFGASEGIVLGLGSVEDAAVEEGQVANVAPITILGPADLAEHLISEGVGVGKFSVDVSCFDDVFFRELRKS